MSGRVMVMVAPLLVTLECFLWMGNMKLLYSSRLFDDLMETKKYIVSLIGNNRDEFKNR